MRAGWVCEAPGCGCLDKELLDSHHIQPKSLYPDLADDDDNGKCLCLWHHAKKHTGWIKEKILARLGEILGRRMFEVKNENRLHI